jgi:hypothetical protein
MKYDKQLCLAAKRKLCHELEEHYREKLTRLLESQERYSKCRWHDEQGGRSTCNGRPTHYGDCCRFEACCSGYKDSRRDGKPPPKDGKFNRPCHLHGANSKHSYDKCRQNPKNQAHANNSNNYIKKCTQDVHYHHSRRHGSDNEPLVSCTSPALSNGELSVNESSKNCTLENYHLDSFHIPKKRKVGNVGHKSPENNALVEAGIPQNLDAIFNNDVTVDLFLKAFQEDHGLSMQDTNDAFKFKNWWSASVKTRTEYHTVLGNCTNCILGNCTADCTDLGSIQYKNLGILTNKQLSRIMNSDFNGTDSSMFSTGNAPKDLIIDQCYMADHIDAKSKIEGKEIVFLIVLKIGIEHQ